MIHDTLANAASYAALGPRIVRGFAWLSQFDPATPDGTVDIEPGVMFALVQSYDTRPPEATQFEAHRLHLDIQILAAGTENILRAPTLGLVPSTEYNLEKDIIFFNEPARSFPILCTPGTFTLLLPQDAHKPGVMAGASERVKKVVLKIRLE